MPLTQVQGAMWLTQTWTTATRPSSPYAGQMGFNSTLGYPEWWSSVFSNWVPFNSSPGLSITVLVGAVAEAVVLTLAQAVEAVLLLDHLTQMVEFHTP